MKKAAKSQDELYQNEEPWQGRLKLVYPIMEYQAGEPLLQWSGLRRSTNLFLLVTILVTAFNFWFFSHPAHSQDNDNPRPQLQYSDQIVAVVGNKVITNYDLEKELARLLLRLEAKRRAGVPPEEVEREYEQLRENTLQHLVENILILLAAEETHIDVQDEVDRAMKHLLEKFGNDPVKFETALRQQGFSTIDEFRKRMEEEKKKERVVMTMVDSSVRVPLEEVEQQFWKTYPATASCKLGSYTKYIFPVLHFSLPSRTKIGEYLEIYAMAYKCYEKLMLDEFSIEDAAVKCVPREAAGGKALTVAQKMVLEADDSKLYDAGIQKAVDELKKPDSPLFAPPVTVKSGVFILAKPSTKTVCIESQTEKQQFVDAIMAKLTQEEREKKMRAWLDELRAKWKVEIKHHKQENSP